MLEFLNDNTFVMLGGRVFQQTVGIPMGTSCARYLTTLAIIFYEARTVGSTSLIRLSA
jgi:hypothetical protein